MRFLYPYGVLSHWILEENILISATKMIMKNSPWISLEIKETSLPKLPWRPWTFESQKNHQATCRPHIHRNNKTAHLVTRKGVANARPSYTKWPGQGYLSAVGEVYWNLLVLVILLDFCWVCFLEGGAVELVLLLFVGWKEGEKEGSGWWRKQKIFRLPSCYGCITSFMVSTNLKVFVCF